MATAPVMPPLVNTLPPAPNSATDTPAEFDNNANATVAAQVLMIPEINTASAWMNSTASEMYNNAVEAGLSASNATESEADAVSAANTAQSVANFKGKWSDLTGPLSVPSSVYHNSKTWSLLSNVADVTASEPGVSSDWYAVDAINMSNVRSARLSDPLSRFFTKNKIVNSGSGRVSVERSSIKHAESFYNDVRQYPADALVFNPDGYLIEPSATNFITHSADFSDVSWSKNGVSVTSDSTNSPLAGELADSVTATSDGGYIEFLTVAAPTEFFTASVFLKSDTPKNVALALRVTTGGVPTDNLVVISVGTEWERFSVSSGGVIAGSTVALIIGGFITFPAGSQFYAWGAQLQYYTYTTSPIPTSGSPVTVLRDNVSLTADLNVPDISKPFSALLKISGDAFGRTLPADTSPQYQSIISVRDNSDDEMFSVGTERGASGVKVYGGIRDASEIQYLDAYLTQNRSFNVAITYDGAVLTQYIDGLLQSSISVFSVGGAPDNVIVGSGLFPFSVSDLRFYDFCMTHDEVAFLGGA